jgi:FtsP/CotA-like multicopper oxidase with cupredoxin domain
MMNRTTRGYRRGRALLAAAVVLVTVATVVPQTARLGSSGKANAAALSATDEAKVPHYFGPYPNWANSPQVMPNALVTVAGPTAVAQASGGVDAIVVTESGAGYVSPLVAISSPTSPGGTPALASATVGTGGTITVTVTAAGSGYLTAPTITITEADPNAIVTRSAVGHATISVDRIDVTAGAAGYTSAPAVTVTEAGGSTATGAGATATATALDGNGALTAITVGAHGGGYSVPMVVVAPSPAAAEANATIDPKDGSISGVAVTSAGSGYSAPPTVTITAPGAHQEPFVQATAVATLATGAITSVTVDAPGYGYHAPVVTATPASTVVAVASGGVDDLILVDGGSNYMNQPIVEFSLPELAGGTQATGTAVMNAEGIVTAVNIVDAGSGYTSAPVVHVWDGNADNPAGAQVTATINVSHIDVTDIGSGYTTAPTLTISDTAPGTGSGAVATAAVAAQGAIADITITNPGKGYLTPGLKKFVDTLPGMGEGAANNLGEYLPVGAPDTTTYPGTDYYEIAVVQYRHQFHSDLPPTLLRGYVQISTSVVPGHHVALSNANVDPSVADTPILLDGQPVYGVDTPHYLGPTILASKNRPVRILFRNLLPTGSNGDLFLPVDTTLMGSGSGPGVEGKSLVGAMMLNPDGTPMDMAADQGTVTDGVRNPVCNNSPKPAGCYTENRAELHLHGGVTPWISDGTPHQWVTPANEGSAYPKGVSVSSVPDMPDPGPGAETFFYTNQQSARLMFYHDHAWGITRLNVYAGEAAPYLITDSTEQKLFGPGGAFADLGAGTPLVVQDKTFVPSDDVMAKQDPTWDKVRWGGLGSLWTPHVYMPAQNPGDATGMSSFGRWMYGPWFWPPATSTKYAPIDNPYYDANCDPNVASFCEPAQIPGTPNISVGMEAFNDTPLVNGVAYPTTTVDPKAYRFRVLNAANDRFFNLSLYVADPTTGTMSEVALNQAEVAAAQTDPVVFPTPDTAKSPAGPDWIQIASEGGFLPEPVVVPAQPTTWITDPTRFDVGNADAHSLLLAPAERADVIVDFSQFRGKTLIVYNDAPAAFPARVPGYDYYTGGPDLSPAGAPTTLPGYGPNTRTVMQIKVSSKAPGVRFDKPGTTVDRLGALTAAFAHKADGTGVFEAGQHAPIVGQAAYNSALGTNFVSTGWCNSPSRPTAKCDGYARIAEQGGQQFKFDTVDPNAHASTTVAAGSAGIDVTAFDGAGGHPTTLSVSPTSVGFGETGKLTVVTATGTANLTYTGLKIDKTTSGLMQEESTARAVTFTGVRYASGVGVLASGDAVNGPQGQLAVPFEPKAIHDEMNSATFDEYGRMTANLGLEAPGATPLTQNIILYPYTSPATEILKSADFPTTMDVKAISSAADGTQIWKITHNGVDTHPVHFHLYDVQVINRVTWDNIVIPPDPTELGWKDTVRVSPLEDTIVAVRPIIPVLPFAIPDSRRPLNPMMPLGAKGDQTGPLGSQAGFNNTDVNGNPIDPIINTVQNFHWEYVLHCHILSHEEMDMMRPVQVEVTWLAPDAPLLQPGDVSGDGVRLTWNDPTPVRLSGTELDLTFANTNMKKSEIGFRIERSVDGSGEWSQVGTALANATTYTDLTGVPGTSYLYRVTPWNEAGATPSNEVGVAGPASAPPAPTLLTAAVKDSSSIVLGWKPPTTAAVTGIVVERAADQGAFQQVATLPLDVNPAGIHTRWTDTTVSAGVAYQYRVSAVNAGGTSLPSAAVSIRVDSSSTTLTHTPSPSASSANVRFTATVAATLPGLVPTGTVTFTVNGTDQTPALLDVNGVATLDTAALPAGPNLITATYNGSPSLLSSSATVTHTVRPAVALSTDASPAMYGDPVVFSAVITPGTATGTVTFTFDKGLASEVSRTAPVVSGTATYSSSTLTVGLHSVVATYNGDGSYLSGVSSSMQQSITATATTVALASNRNPAQPTQVVTFTATVTESVSGAAVTAGVVTFRITNPGTPDATETVAVDTQGRATFSTTSLSEATHVVTATFNATIPWSASVSAPLSQVVAKLASTVSVRTSRTPSVFGQAVTFTATMNDPAAAGTVTFTIDGTRKVTGVVDTNGEARVVVGNLTVGTHRVMAAYGGSALFRPSTSTTLGQVVAKAATSTRVVSSAPTARRHSVVTFTVTVTAVSPGVGAPRGTVRLVLGGVVRDVVLNQAGRATYSTAGLTVGSHTITATYLGNVNFVGSSASMNPRQRII